ncbi:MAG: hypothetical protein VX112_05320 [Pseudomonadota bacterium]|nr:hypothetical protein [Pseudomonadota bacterium]
MFADYARYQTPKKSKFRFTFSLAACIVACFAFTLYAPTLYKHGVIQIESIAMRSIPTLQAIQNKIFIPVQRHQVIFRHVNTTRPRHDHFQYQLDTPCLANSVSTRKIKDSLTRQELDFTVKTYQHNKQPCNIVSVGPYSNYTEAQEAHLIMQAENINHTLFTER